MLLFLLMQKFKIVPEHYCETVKKATPDLLKTWAERILICQTIEDVFQTSQS
jgi:hypothetical protein